MGLKVIGSTGSDEKVQYIKSLGADHAFNYKTSNVSKELRKHGPVDIYFDNVGGETLESAIENAAQKARFVICGAISTYNQGMNEAYGVKVRFSRAIVEIVLYYLSIDTELVALESIPDKVSMPTFYPRPTLITITSRMEGLIVIDWHEKYGQEFYETMSQLVASGEIKYVEHIYRGFEEAGQALRDILSGKNKGKVVVEVADG